MGYRLKIARSNQPENSDLGFALVSSKTQTQIPEAARCLGTLALHELENRLIQRGTRFSTIRARLGQHGQLRLQPTPLKRPEISRVNTFGPHQLLHIAILRKERHSRDRLVSQYRLQIFCERKTGVFNLGHGILSAELWMLHKLLRSSFHSSQQQRRAGQPHHFQHTDGLMQLLAGNSQLTGLYCGKIRTACHFGVPGETFERFGSALQRLSKLVKYPSQRAQVAHGGIRFGGD